VIRSALFAVFAENQQQKNAHHLVSVARHLFHLFLQAKNRYPHPDENNPSPASAGNQQAVIDRCRRAAPHAHQRPAASVASIERWK
jgi:hypothetical protein